jgi:hypothetical protein
MCSLGKKKPTYTSREFESLPGYHCTVDRARFKFSETDSRYVGISPDLGGKGSHFEVWRLRPTL